MNYLIRTTEKKMTADERVEKFKELWRKNYRESPPSIFCDLFRTHIKSAEQVAFEEGRQVGLKQELEKSMKICKDASEEGYAEGFSEGALWMREEAAKRVQYKLNFIPGTGVIADSDFAKVHKLICEFMEEIRICHGACHNDTIVTVEVKP